MTQHAVLIYSDWPRRPELGDAIGIKQQAANTCQPAMLRPQVLPVGLTHQRTRLIPARWSGKLNRPTGGDLHGELVQRSSGHSHT